MRWRRDPLHAEPKAKKRAQIALRPVMAGERFTVVVEPVDDAENWRHGQFLARIEGCDEDEFGVAALGPTPVQALCSLGAHMLRVTNPDGGWRKPLDPRDRGEDPREQ